MGRIEHLDIMAPRPRPLRIERTPGVCGGAARIAATRIAVWMLEEMRRLGESDHEILQAYPSLSRLDLADAWSYVDEHREEIDVQIRENKDA